MYFAKAAFLALSAIFAFGAVTQAGEVIDATGAKVKVPDTATRVVTLMPSLGELAADLLGDELSRLVGSVEQTDYPPALSRLPSVGPFSRFNLERVVALKPDLVLASTDGNPKDLVMRLRELGLAVVVVDTATFKQVSDSMILVAGALGNPKRGEEMAAQFRRGVDAIRMRNLVKSRTPPRVLLQIGSKPLVVAGPNTFLDEALKVAGGENIYADAGTRYPRPSLEDAISRRPDVIIVFSMSPDRSTAREAIHEWTAYPRIPAVKSQKVRILAGDTILRPTLRLLEGLALLEKGINE